MLPTLLERCVHRLAGGVAGSARDSLSWQLGRPAGGEQRRGRVAATRDIRAAPVGAAQAPRLKPLPERAAKRAQQRTARLADEGFEDVDTTELIWSSNDAGDRYPRK